MLKIKAKKKREGVNIYLENDLSAHNYAYALIALIIKLSNELTRFFPLEKVVELHEIIMQEIKKEHRS